MSIGVEAAPADVMAVVRRVPGWTDVRPSDVTALSGGITNRNYVVITPQDGRCVLRLAGKDTDMLGIDRAVEAAANRQAASLGIAPEVVHVVEPEGYLVTRFVDGGPVPDITDPSTMDELARALRTWHESDPIPGEFDAFAIPHSYGATAAARGVRIPDAFDRALVVADEIRAVFIGLDDRPVPCHDDLLNANLLRADDGRLILLDWEYAGMGSRWFDLGNLATNHELDADARDLLLRCYFGSVTPGRRARLDLMQVMSDLREAMWGVVQQGISTLDFDYADYADRHFQRLLRNAGSPAFRTALALGAEE